MLDLGDCHRAVAPLPGYLRHVVLAGDVLGREVQRRWGQDARLLEFVHLHLNLIIGYQ